MATRIPPEILHTIFKELENHHLSKYILVSKYWCSNILPILWSNPLEKMYWQYHYRIIEVYISCLNKESKQILREHNIIHEATKESFSATYDYTQYLREVEFNGLYEACGNWLHLISDNDLNPSYNNNEEEEEDDDDENHDDGEDFATRLFNKCFHYARFSESRLSDSIKKSKKDNIYDKQLQSRIIFKEVLKLFVENRLIRYKLIIQSGFYSFNHLSVIPEIIPNGSHLDFMRINSNNQHSVLESLSPTFTSIDKLTIKCDDDDDGLASYLINGLPTINFLKIHMTNKDMPKLSNSINEVLIKNKDSLIHLWLKQGDAKNMKPSFWTEDTLIPFISSSPTNSLNRLTEFSLSIDASVNLIHLSTIIQNTCGLLEYLFLKWEIEQDSQNSCLLFQSILENCQKLSGIFITTSIDTIKFIPRFLMECSKLKYLGVDCLRKDNLDLTDWLPKIGMAIRNRNNNDSLTQIELLGFYFKFISSVKSFNEFLDDCSSNNGDKCEKDDLLELYFHNAIDWMNEEKIILLRQYANSDKIQCSLSEIDEIVLYNIENNILTKGRINYYKYCHQKSKLQPQQSRAQPPDSWIRWIHNQIEFGRTPLCTFLFHPTGWAKDVSAPPTLLIPRCGFISRPLAPIRKVKLNTFAIDGEEMLSMEIV
ncbi:hypothetical protein GLOIN_2v1534893 [Rhizophagus irregularis DAOM 181602=DAOM 197198]|nr:hypothetical protein GLOIN_2v1534893 [Rhizophagus irregularis DAOM 181602=DAOM 197198]